MIKLLPLLLISELLFNPFPSGADYLELYNYGEEPISLAEIRLAKVDESGAIAKLYKISDTAVVAPHDYVVITTDAQHLNTYYHVRYPEKVLEVGSMPSFPDAEGSVVVAMADSSVVDRFDYSSKMHSRLMADVEGVSLERRSFDAPTQSPNNWYSAATTTRKEGFPEGGLGTPTCKNSQSTEFLFTTEDFHLEPEIFSPDGDGYNDQADLTYQLADPDLTANITIFDSKGRLVRHLLRGGLLGSQGSVTWDGLDDAGLRCHRGIYTIVIEAFNAGGAKQITKKCVTLVIR